jgi:lipoprotein-anchoring transpeptidase ErfK/SrfK
VLDVLAAQVILDRLGFSPGEIDGMDGANFRRAVDAFQRARDLPVSGQLDPATAAALVPLAGTEPTLVPYAITPEDVKGPFAPQIPRDLMAQSKLPRLDYRNPLEGIAERVHASPGLLRRLNPGAAFTQAGAQIQVPNVWAIPPALGANAARIVVRAATSALTVEDHEGRIIFHAPVTSGSRRDPLPIGTWKVTSIHEMPPFHYNPDLFWDANPKHSKARIAPGPNNPVGVMWIDISKEHYGIHGTPEPSVVGHTQSHGCIRLTNWDVRRVAQWARPGLAVVFE